MSAIELSVFAEILGKDFEENNKNKLRNKF